MRRDRAVAFASDEQKEDDVAGAGKKSRREKSGIFGRCVKDGLRD